VLQLTGSRGRDDVHRRLSGLARNAFEERRDRIVGAL
jgi:hypothetical protein